MDPQGWFKISFTYSSIYFPYLGFSFSGLDLIRGKFTTKTKQKRFALIEQVEKYPCFFLLSLWFAKDFICGALSTRILLTDGVRQR